MSNNIQLKELKLQQWQVEEGKSAVSRTVAQAGRKYLKSSAIRSNRASASSERKRPPPIIKLADESMSSDMDSDNSSSSYDSFNDRVTDLAQDTDDTDNFVLGEIDEYELDYTSSSEDLFSNGSSSGTDDMVVKVVAHALFDLSNSSSDDFEILADDADTEESDAPTDPELGPADYWTCIKCKNQKNTPYYRYCEKCFQIRKTHFPPRPKHQKKRLRRKKDINGNYKRLRHHSNVDSVADIGKFLSNSSSSSKSRAANEKSACGHGAGDSSCCSCQELSPDEQQSTTSHPKPMYLDACASSQETYCSEIERSVDAKIKINPTIFESNYPSSQESIFPSSSQMSSQRSTQISTESSTQSSSMCGQLSAQSSASSNADFLANMARPIEISSSLSSGDFAPILSPMVSHTQDFTLKSLANEFNGTNATVATKQKKPKKRKRSLPQMVSDTDDDDLIKNSPKKAKKMPPMMPMTPTRPPPPPRPMDGTNDTESLYGNCIICLTRPKDAAFVHNRVVHVSCCYKCASKVWNKRKRCPVCNSQANNVLKIFVH